MHLARRYMPTYDRRRELQQRGFDSFSLSKLDLFDERYIYSALT